MAGAGAPSIDAEMLQEHKREERTVRLAGKPQKPDIGQAAGSARLVSTAHGLHVQSAGHDESPESETALRVSLIKRRRFFLLTERLGASADEYKAFSMGALLSLPLLAVPSIGSILAFGASCCGAATCSAICSACGKFQSSMATRIAYAFMLLINSILSWVMLTRWALNQLEHLTFDFLPITCDGQKCHGWVAVHRINFALGLFHMILALVLLGVRSTKDERAKLQNGFWGPKVIIWLAFIVLSFFIPESFFIIWGSYVAFIGAMLFLLLGLILLVDLAHNWAELCLRKIEENGSRLWQGLLIGSTLGMYLASIAMTVVMYVFFAGYDCAMNKAAITVNLILFLIISFMSVQPAIQEANPRAGLAQAAMVTVYCTYLTMSAVSMEPDDKQCNPLLRASNTRTASVVIGAVVTMLAVAYTTTRAATQGFAMGSSAAQNNYSTINQEDVEHDLVVHQPQSNRQMRAEALRAAVNSGSLPASALDDSDDESDDGNDSKDDERNSTQYNYSLFHIIFLLATMWVATLLTQHLDMDAQDDLAPVGRTYWASWVKIISAWVCYAIYLWTLVAPVLLPDRFGV